jgi:hypothetical protein
MTQKNNLLIVIAVGLLAFAGIGTFYLSQKPISKSPDIMVIRQTGYKDISYEIDGQTVLLKNGVAETEIVPGSASKSVTRYFGNEVRGDFNADGLEDVAFLLTQNNGGSGTFYYVVAALKKSGGNYTGTNAILLGDRIAPQTIEFKNNEIIVNYSDRKPGDAMTTPPSVGISKYLEVDEVKLVEVSK